MQSAQIERLVGGSDVEDMRMLTVTLKVDRNSPVLRGEDVRIKAVFYDQDRQTRKIEVSSVRIPEANATLSGVLQPDETITVTRPYVVPAGFRRTQGAGRSLTYYGFMVEIYHRDRLLQQYARPSSLLGN
jgi:hypothetical protein